jgi:hypothetical protein
MPLEIRSSNITEKTIIAVAKNKEDKINHYLIHSLRKLHQFC